VELLINESENDCQREPGILKYLFTAETIKENSKREVSSSHNI